MEKRGLGDNIVRITVLTKLMHIFTEILIKISAHFFAEIDKVAINSYVNSKDAE